MSEEHVTFSLTEADLVARLMEFVRYCDADELAELAGFVYGGTCVVGNDLWVADEPTNLYEFIPNEDYAGEFGPDL